MRIEFVATDLDNSGDSTGVNEGFFRVYQANSGTLQTHWLRGDWLGDSSNFVRADSLLNCGDWHRVWATGANTDTMPKFFPWAAHYHTNDAAHGVANTWFDTIVARGMSGGINPSNVNTARAEADSVLVDTKFSAMLGHPNVRCYLGGDPHLVALHERRRSAANAAIHKGGDDTTFTATDQYGAWRLYSTTPPAIVATKRPYDANYLYPLYRGFNTNTKGVIYAGGTIGISGVVRGLITLYAANTVVVLDDVRYANDPAKGVCLDILGTISGDNTVVADNAINTPVPVKLTSPRQYRSMDDTPDLFLHDVVMALGTSFQVEDYGNDPTSALTCGTTSVGRGCLNLTGGLIQNRRGPVGTTSGTGTPNDTATTLRDRESAAVLPDDRPLPGQSLLRAGSLRELRINGAIRTCI